MFCEKKIILIAKYLNQTIRLSLQTCVWSQVWRRTLSTTVPAVRTWSVTPWKGMNVGAAPLTTCMTPPSRHAYSGPRKWHSCVTTHVHSPTENVSYKTVKPLYAHIFIYSKKVYILIFVVIYILDFRFIDHAQNKACDTSWMIYR